MDRIIINNINELSYEVTCDSHAIKTNFIDVWIKFAGHLTAEESLILVGLRTKDLSAISITELEKYKKIRNQLDVSKLLVKYKNKECTREEHDLVYNFVHTSLTAFIESRFTSDEKQKAKTSLEQLDTKEKLIEFVKENEANYDALDIYEAYLLYLAEEKKYDLETSEHIEYEMAMQARREASLRKHLERDFGPSWL